MMVLPNCESWYKYNIEMVRPVLNLMEDSEIIDDLSIDFGINK